jgi:hypothetical protein
MDLARLQGGSGHTWSRCAGGNRSVVKGPRRIWSLEGSRDAANRGLDGRTNQHSAHARRKDVSWVLGNSQDWIYGTRGALERSLRGELHGDRVTVTEEDLMEKKREKTRSMGE